MAGSCYTRGVLNKYARLVGSAARGALFTSDNRRVQILPYGSSKASETDVVIHEARLGHESLQESSDLVADNLAMSLGDEEIIDLLYRHLLGRESDPDGRANLMEALASGADLRTVLAGFVESPEYQALHKDSQKKTRVCQEVAATARAAMARSPQVLDIGAHGMDGGDHAYSPLWDYGEVDVIGFEPQSDRAIERIQEDSEDIARSGETRIFPVALGDGNKADLHINNVDATSSLFAFNRNLVDQFDGLAELETVDVVPIETTKLDEVDVSLPIDLMKLDVQGAELSIVQSASHCLNHTAVVHCEMEFGEIYKGQPLFHEVDRELRMSGFELIDIFPIHYSFSDVSESKTKDVLLWADVVYFAKTNDRQLLLSQALCAAAIYEKPNLASHCLALAFAVSSSD
jgi:FkbM family methyltransferase